MNKKEAVDYLQRWREVERFQESELRETPMAERFKQVLAAHRMAEGLGLGRRGGNEAEEEAVISRWRRLREALGGKGTK